MIHSDDSTKRGAAPEQHNVVHRRSSLQVAVVRMIARRMVCPGAHRPAGLTVYSDTDGMPDKNERAAEVSKGPAR